MIRELVVDDVDYFHEIEEKFPDLFNNDSIVNEYQSNPYTRFLVYLLDDKIVGFINYYEIYDRLEIANFNVLPFFQNHGVGSALLEYLIGKFQNKMKNITLEVRNDNTKAINLYKKYDFREKAIRRNYYNDNIDGILMEKELM